MDYEAFRRDPQQTVEGISAFLGVGPPPQLNYTWKYNKANTRDRLAMKKRSEITIPTSMKEKISREVTPFVAKMYEIIKQDYGWIVTSLV